MPRKKSNANTVKDDRTRNWVFVLYPESAPPNWRDVLDEQHIPWIESPLHEFDTDADGEVKKPHYHVLLLFEGKKSYEQIKAITDSLNAPIPQKCANVKGMVRYFVHLDNPDKTQYSLSDIIGHGGADVASYLRPTSAARYELIGEMMDYVRDNQITEMMDLTFYARENRFEDWFPLLCDNSAYIINLVIKSMRHRMDRKDNI